MVYRISSSVHMSRYGKSNEKTMLTYVYLVCDEESNENLPIHIYTSSILSELSSDLIVMVDYFDFKLTSFTSNQS